MSRPPSSLELPNRPPDLAIGDPDQAYMLHIWDPRPDETGALVNQYHVPEGIRSNGNAPDVSVELDEIDSVAAEGKPLVAFYGYIGLRTSFQEQQTDTHLIERQEVLFPHPDAVARQLHTLSTVAQRYVAPVAPYAGKDIPPETWVKHIATDGTFLMCTERAPTYYGNVYDALSTLPATVLLTEGIVKDYRDLCERALDPSLDPTVAQDAVSAVTYQFIHHVNALELAKPVAQALQAEHTGIPLSHEVNLQARDYWRKVAAAIGGLLGSSDKEHVWGHTMMMRDQAKWLATLDFSVLRP